MRSFRCPFNTLCPASSVDRREKQRLAEEAARIGYKRKPRAISLSKPAPKEEVVAPVQHRSITIPTQQYQMRLSEIDSVFSSLESDSTYSLSAVLAPPTEPSVDDSVHSDPSIHNELPHFEWPQATESVHEVFTGIPVINPALPPAPRVVDVHSRRITRPADNSPPVHLRIDDSHLENPLLRGYDSGSPVGGKWLPAATATAVKGRRGGDDTATGLPSEKRQTASPLPHSVTFGESVAVVETPSPVKPMPYMKPGMSAVALENAGACVLAARVLRHSFPRATSSLRCFSRICVCVCNIPAPSAAATYILPQTLATGGDRLMTGIGPEMPSNSSFHPMGRRTRRRPKFGVAYHWDPSVIVVKQPPQTHWSLPHLVGKDDRRYLSDTILHGAHRFLKDTRGLVSGAEAARDNACGTIELPVENLKVCVWEGGGRRANVCEYRASVRIGSPVTAIRSRQCSDCKLSRCIRSCTGARPRGPCQRLCGDST